MHYDDAALARRRGTAGLSRSRFVRQEVTVAKIMHGCKSKEYVQNVDSSNPDRHTHRSGTKYNMYRSTLFSRLEALAKVLLLLTYTGQLASLRPEESCAFGRRGRRIRTRRAQRMSRRGSEEDPSRVVVAIDKAWPLLLLLTVISLIAKPAANCYVNTVNTMSNTTGGPSGHVGPWGIDSDSR